MRKDIHLDRMNIHWAKDIQQKAVYKQMVLCMQDLVSESSNRKQWRNRMVWKQQESQMCNHNLSRFHQNLNSQMFEWMWMAEMLNYMVEKRKNQRSNRKVSRQDEDCKTMVRMVVCLAGDTFVFEWRMVVVVQLVDQMASGKDNLSLEQELCRLVADWSKAAEMVEVFPAVFGCYTVVDILEDPTVDELQEKRFQITRYRRLTITNRVA